MANGELTPRELADVQGIPQGEVGVAPPGAAPPAIDPVAQAFTEAVLATPPQATAPRARMSFGQALSAGIIAALDPQSYQAIVLPAVRQEQAALSEQQRIQTIQRQQRLSNLGSLATFRANEVARAFARDITSQQNVRAQSAEDRAQQRFDTDIASRSKNIEQRVDNFAANQDATKSTIAALRASDNPGLVPLADQLEAAQTALGLAVLEANERPDSEKDPATIAHITDLADRFEALQDRAVDSLADDFQKQRALDARLRAQFAKNVNENTSLRISEGFTGVNLIRGAKDFFEVSGQPGTNPLFFLIPKRLESQEFKEFNAAYTAALAKYKKLLLGSAISEAELKDKIGIFPKPGETDAETMRQAMVNLELAMTMELKNQINGLVADGFNMGQAEFNDGVETGRLKQYRDFIENNALPLTEMGGRVPPGMPEGTVFLGTAGEGDKQMPMYQLPGGDLVIDDPNFEEVGSLTSEVPSLRLTDEEIPLAVDKIRERLDGGATPDSIAESLSQMMQPEEIAMLLQRAAAEPPGVFQQVFGQEGLIGRGAQGLVDTINAAPGAFGEEGLITTGTRNLGRDIKALFNNEEKK